MKRVIAIFSAAVMLFASTACDKKEKEREITLSENEAYTQYVTAVNALRDAGSFGGELSFYVTSDVMGEDYDVEAQIGIKHVLGEGDHLQAEIDTTGGPENFKAYYKDGEFYYVDYQEDGIGNFKFAMPGADLLSMTNSSLVTDALFSEEDIIELEAIEDAGGIAVRFVVKESGIQEYLRAYANYTMTSGVNDGHADTFDYVFDDVVVMVRLGKNGELINVQLLFLLSIIHYDEEMVSYIEIGMHVTECGGVVIDFPEDMESFTDFDEPIA